MAEKESRCWPGYEPVKGKKQHEQGSCRLKAESKSTSGEKKFRAARRSQLDKWDSEHPNTRKSAAQHLHAPGTETKTAAKKKATKKTAAKRTSTKKTASKASTARKKTASKK